jgi:hypothetical protein
MGNLRVRRASLAVVLAAAAVAVGGCTHATLKTTTTSAPAPLPESAGLQVEKTCVQNIFYNGLLPEGPARTECVQCVVHALGQLGFRQSPGESAAAMIAEVQLSARQSSELSNACSQSDADN